MAFLLTPREYSNLRWDLTPTNIIDTLTGKTLINRVDIEPQTIHSDSTTSGYIGGVKENFPIDKGNKFPLTTWAWARGRVKPLGQTHYYNTKMRSEMIIASDSFVVPIDVPIEGNNVISMSPQGKSYEYSDSVKPAWSVFPEDYDNLVRSAPFDDYFSALSNVTTGGLNSDDFRIGGSNAFVNHLGSYPVNDSGVRWPSKWSKISGTQPEGVAWTNPIKKVVSIEPLGNRLYRFNWSCPIKQLMMAMHREGPGDTAYIKSWKMFMDVVTSIQFEVSGRPFNTEKISFTYSLDNGQVSATKIKNFYPQKVEDNELITLHSTLNGKPWSEEISRIILNKYKDGKYIATANVKGDWMLRNNIHINSKGELVNLRGEKISRAGKVCTFEVKAIEKCFNSGSFYYRTLFLEV